MSWLTRFLKRNNPQALPVDVKGKMIQGGDVPIDHAAYLREIISYNANGDAVQIDKVYDDGEAGEVVFRKRITPADADEIVAATQTLYAWAKV